MEKLQARLQAASTEYQKLQSDLSVAVDSRQRLDAQLQENEMVKKVGALWFTRHKLVETKPTSGVRSIDPRKRSLQTHRSRPGETGPAGGKNECEPTTGIDPGRHVALPRFPVYSKSHFETFRKRLEAQIKEIGGKLDKKKMEVCAG